MEKVLNVVRGFVKVFVFCVVIIVGIFAVAKFEDVFYWLLIGVNVLIALVLFIYLCELLGRKTTRTIIDFSWIEDFLKDRIDISKRHGLNGLSKPMQDGKHYTLNEIINKNGIENIHVTTIVEFYKTLSYTGADITYIICDMENKIPKVYPYYITVEGADNKYEAFTERFELYKDVMIDLYLKERTV
ncbi:MAG: hypothetical protein ACRC0V_11005 [Fusobacteriaceae bacterium]